MISLRSSRNGNSGALVRRSVTSSTQRALPVGATSFKKPADSFTSESNSGAIPTGLGPNTGISGNAITVDLSPMMTGLTPVMELSPLMYRLYRDIYLNDSVAGSAVDMMSSLPFSEFSLGGAGVQGKILDVFMENIERVNIRTLMPEASTDYLVTGAHISSLVYNKDRKMFVDVIPHSVENCKIQPLPFFSQDPIITVSFAPETRAALQAAGNRRKILEKLVGREVLSKIEGGSLELDPLSTLYIPRRTFSDNAMSGPGTSFLRRILPLYLIEKNLYRGTLIESARRQRGILHASMSGGEDWEPSVADLEFLTELFMNADSDPLGAIIATRDGITVEEIRPGGEFWKVTDLMDVILPYKLRALGISEAFLNGDANYQAADQGLTVFVEMLRSYREMMTRKIFYNKLFPTISLVNGYTISTKGKVSTNPGLASSLAPEDATFMLNNGSRLLIPTVSWAKQLKPEGDQAYMDMLVALSEKGVPVPLRVLAAAGGLNMDELLKQQEEDLDLRKQVQEYQKKVSALAPKPEEGMDGMGGSDEESESSSMPVTRSAVLNAVGGRKPLLSRDFGSASELVSYSKTGKKQAVYNQRAANDRINMALARAMKASAEKHGRVHTVKVQRSSSRERSPI